LTDRLAQSSSVVASGSGFACVNPANGCVAAPALTPAVIGGQFLKAFPKQFARGVRNGEIGIILAMNPRVLAGNLHADASGKSSVRLDDMKFREAIF
jgi:hypothetical protein